MLSGTGVHAKFDLLMANFEGRLKEDKSGKKHY